MTAMIRWAGLAATVIAVLVTTFPAVACRGRQFEHRILLDAIPPAVESSEVIAKVEIVEVNIHRIPGMYPFRVARGRVLQSIRGPSDGQLVEIYAEGDSCGGWLDQRAVGRMGFIAGRFRKIGSQLLFEGSWTDRQLGKI
ncbi:hypothetical protein [Bradyrhizobium sp. CCGE-LA001]|uniref:hypothetical protein n=1 Tax=Bradyrhizobium sp. CCGE-LA001 TaxID=1223566 RepID=UPI00119827E8|nr:hypothetical protein [Bradyrhizobium sp. CCGE-LA001]